MFFSFWADPADQLRVDERGAVRQVAFRIFQPSCAARQLPGAGDRRDGRQARLEVRLNRGRRGWLRRKGLFLFFVFQIGLPMLHAHSLKTQIRIQLKLRSFQFIIYISSCTAPIVCHACSSNCKLAVAKLLRVEGGRPDEHQALIRKRGRRPKFPLNSSNSLPC